MYQARHVTEKKMRAFGANSQESAPSFISYVGTVIGLIVGLSYLSTTLVFTNLTFIITKIEYTEASG